ncbi:hypothetical protein DdX_19422 [Ditylenchus destructor]|uniref:Uncharacterized protein n=1 Tax=Ditylenchus destructor TaxID=166010 RepID=A0AAD4MIW3_9BILA|nr:hypothetical protein DdX_19422 [Ditylenchus destructor]
MDFATYLPYITFGQAIVALLSRTVSLCFISRLLCVTRKLFLPPNGNLSYCLAVYLIFNWIMACLHLPYLVYIIAKTTSNLAHPTYEPYEIFWLELWPSVLFSCAGIPVIFLSVDRCLAIRLLTRYTSQVKVKLVIAEIVLSAIVAGTCFAFFLQELPLSMSTSCTSLPCLSIKFRAFQLTIPKLMLSAVSVSAGIVFLFFMGNVDFKLMRNRVVKYTVILDFVMNVVPICSSLIFNLCTGVSVTSYLGEYSPTLNTVESAILSVYYYRVLVWRRKQNVTINKMVSLQATTVI